MRRMLDLVELTKKAHPHDQFFANLDETLRSSSQARAQYKAYDRALSYLDPESWKVLSEKAVVHFTDHREGQLKQGFFNQLNEAFAYQFLIRRGYKGVTVLREDGSKKPDLTYINGTARHYCEVKSIGISDNELNRRAAEDVFDASIYQKLSEEFLLKFDGMLKKAYVQISSQSGPGLVFVVARFDDFTLSHYDKYRKQISQLLSTHEVPEVFVKIGLIGSRYIHKQRNHTETNATN
jgi:hypothetical protein